MAEQAQQPDADAVATLCAITGCPAQQAQVLLQGAAGNVELAVNDFFMAMEGGGGGGWQAAPAPAAAGGGGGAATAGGGGGGAAGAEAGEDSTDDEDEEFFEDSEMLLPPTGGYDAAPSAPLPKAKRAKVDVRQAPVLEPPADTADLRKNLQAVFELGSLPADCADKLHGLVKDRFHSWAHASRSLPYLLECHRRLLTVLGPGDYTAEPAAGACFPLTVLLHHGRAALVSGEANDERMALFQEGGASELTTLLGDPSAASFLTAINSSMTEAEQDQVYGSALDDALKSFATSRLSLGEHKPVSSSSSKPAPDWRATLAEAHTLLALAGGLGAGTQGAVLKPQPQGLAARQVHPAPARCPPPPALAPPPPPCRLGVAV